MSIFMYGKARAFRHIVGLCAWGFIFVDIFAHDAESVSERRYATKNMLTLAQNEQPVNDVVQSVAATPEANTSDQIKAPEISTTVPNAADSGASQLPPVTTSSEPVATPVSGQASVGEAVVPVAEPEKQEVVSTAQVTAKPEATPIEPEKAKKQNGKVTSNGAKKDNGSDLVGIDTVNIDEPEGNWLFKRKYWEQAEYRYEKVKALLEKIMDLRMDFFKKQVDADKNLFDPFYLEVGIKDGKIEQTIDDLITYMDKERQEQGALDQEERNFLSTLQQERAALEQLRQDVQSIKKIDAALSDAMLVVLNVVDQARGFEKQSWQNFKAIARELSDKKAHNLYYGIETYWQNMKDIHVYISMQLSSYLQQLISKAQEQIEKVRAGMEGLKERGVDLKKHAQKMEQEELDKARAQQESLQSQKPQVKQGFVRRVLGWFGSLFGAVWNVAVKAVSSVWQITKGFFGGLFAKKATGQATVLPEVPGLPGQASVATPAVSGVQTGASPEDSAVESKSVMMDSDQEHASHESDQGAALVS